MAVKTRDVLIIGGIAVAGGLAYWWWTSRPPEEEEWFECPYCGQLFSSQAALDIHIATAHGAEPPPDISPYVQAAIQAAAQAEAAAEAALLAETEAEVEYYARLAIDASDVAAAAAEEAIRLAGTAAAAEAIDAANRAEDAARAAMAELERRWRDALETAEELMNEAVYSADQAYGAYETIKDEYDRQQSRYQMAMNQILHIVTDYYLEQDDGGVFSSWLPYGADFSGVPHVTCGMYGCWTYLTELGNLLLEQQAAVVTNAIAIMSQIEPGMETAKLEARFAALAARDVTERALTIAADVRLLGILISLANRIDSIARATRDTLNRMLEELG